MLFLRMTRKERLKKRNENIRALFEKISRQNKKWRTDAVIQEVAERSYLSSRTVEAILKGEGVYAF